MKLQLVLLPLLLSLEVLSLGLYLKALLRLFVLLKNFLMILMMVQLIQLDLFASCLAQRNKRKRLLGGNPICFYLLYLVFLMLVTTVATSFYLYFQVLCQVLASDGK